MKIGIVVNLVEGERAAYTTILLARQALRRGHDVWFVDVAEFRYNTDDSVSVQAVACPMREARSADAFVESLCGPHAQKERVSTDNFDVLFLRNEPSFDADGRPWAQPIGYLFGAVLKSRGVTVISDPDGLARAVSDKMYTQGFSRRVRPLTMITRDVEEIVAFAKTFEANVVLKPLHGGAGRDVFVIPNGMQANVRQVAEVITRQGYVIAQEYLPAAAVGVARLFMLDGKPLHVNGRYALMRHVPTDGDMRSNYRVSGAIAPAEMDDDIMRVVDCTGPRLAADGHFLVGLDIVGDKLLEANLFSPGGLRGAERLQSVNFSDVVVASMEDKVAARRTRSNSDTPASA